MQLNNLKYIEDSLKKSLENYDEKFKSIHWKFYNNKKSSFFNKKDIKNFRNNPLCLNLDDKPKSFDELKNFLNNLVIKTGKNFIIKNLNTNNIGNNKFYFKLNEKYLDFNLLHSINFFYEIINNIKLRENLVFCEIGGGFGQLSKLLIKNTKSKIILIDLPETNFLSSYFLMENFKELKFLLYDKVENDCVNLTHIAKYDVIIVPPWVILDNIIIDIFINIRSMMEMDFNTISHYFELIHNTTSQNGYFVNVNRYLKNTSGFDNKLGEYPYDQNWSVISSKKSEFQPHIHQLITKRTNKRNKSITEELKKIINFTNNNRKFVLAGKKDIFKNT